MGRGRHGNRARDVPLGESQLTPWQTETMTTEEVDDGSRIWNTVVVVLALATTGISAWLLLGGSEPLPADGLGWAAAIFTIATPLLVLALWFALRMRIMAGSRAYLVLMVTLAVLLAFSTWQLPSLASAMSFMMPLTWLATPSNRSAISWSCVLVAAAAVGMLLGGKLPAVYVVFIGVFSMALSAGIGLSIAKLHEQVLARTQLYTELEQKQNEIVQLSSAHAASSERAAVLRDVHDAVTQNLTAIVMQSRMADHDAKLIEELAGEALESTRALLVSASPQQLDAGLSAALERLAERFGRETGVGVTAEISPVQLDLDSEIVLLRACQEMLANVRKHARAERVLVSLEHTDDGVALRVRDNGIGIDTAQTRPDARGLVGIKERVRQAGGRVVIAADHGTDVVVTLPGGAG